jgi:hypothetical protein
MARVGRKEQQIFVTSPFNGRFPAGELEGRDPQLLVTSAILGGAEAHSHIAPTPELFGGRLPNHTEGVWGIGEFAHFLSEEMDFV